MVKYHMCEECYKTRLEMFPDEEHDTRNFIVYCLHEYDRIKASSKKQLKPSQDSRR